PDRRITARRKEREAQRSKTRFFWQRGIARFRDRLAQLGGVLLGSGSRDDDAAHEARMVGRRHPGDPVSIAWPAMTARPCPSFSTASATSRAKSCSETLVIGPLLRPIPRGFGRSTRKPAAVNPSATSS